ncbi:MAG TPA: ATP-grasp domain-containing protein [Tenuifilaceae bacterium]|nr:ATP-grasp domain-containing protein [Tenuifilaceae bacterium]
MLRRKKILVLGTGNAQVDFIEHCKKLGLEVHSCSYLPEGRGIDVSDYFSIINITDINNVTEYVERNGIDVIYSTGSDIAMPTIASVSEKLNLPVFISSKTANTCNHKTLLRNTLKSIPDYSVTSMEVTEESDLGKWAIFPAILKPNDSQGQRGITEIYSADQLLDSFKFAISHSRTKTAIIEEYIEGFEISINIYVVNYQIVLQFITERISFNEYPGGIIKSHLYPVTRKLNIEKITQMSNAVVKTFDIKNGPAYFQIKIDKNENPKIIEITPRLDGCHIWRLISELKGINLFDIIVNHLINNEVDISIFEQNKPDKAPRAELIFFTSSPGDKFSMKNFHAVKDAVYTEWYYRDGEIVRPINQYAEKVGYQIIFHKQ